MIVARRFTLQAFGYPKATDFNAAAKPFLDKVGFAAVEGIVSFEGFVEAAKKRYWDRDPKLRSLA